jgi:hypothetical protein
MCREGKLELLVGEFVGEGKGTGCEVEAKEKQTGERRKGKYDREVSQQMCPG